MEASTYELIRTRLEAQAQDLRSRLDRLHQIRKDTFGTIEMQLIATDRITTQNHCIPRDMVAIGHRFLFGYNVMMGLRSEVSVSDVFAGYRFEVSDHSFHGESLDFMADSRFQEDFQNLYKYYKDTVFARFAIRGPHLFLVFQVGKSSHEIKTFKWAIQDDQLLYLGNRFDHEYRFPDQHEFSWQKAGRDQYRRGMHPHVSILDRVFVETVGGDLTIKVEDNTSTGLGIFSEPVEDPDQTLDDAEYFFADLGNILLLKIRPYQEKTFRHFIFNEKLQEILRVDSLATSAIRLPDEQGLIFSNGYYLHTGEKKIFDQAHEGLRFERRVVSPNGEDILYVFYQAASGQYVLLPYNLVKMDVDSPIHCGGFTIFPNGELCYFRAEEQPGRHHVIQIWRTPYGTGVSEVAQNSGSWIAKVGNKDLVRGMAECQGLLVLLGKEEPYADFYVDLVKKTGDIIDSYFWIAKEEAANLAFALRNIRETAVSAIDEYEKVQVLRANTRMRTEEVTVASQQLAEKIRRRKPQQIVDYVEYLGELRRLRGDIIGLRDLRFADESSIEALEAQVIAQTESLGEATVTFLLSEQSLQPYQVRVDSISEAIGTISRVTEANEVAQDIEDSAKQLELLIDIVSNLKIEDATQTTRIIEHISVVFSRLNGLRASLRTRRQALSGMEAKASFFAQIKLLDQAQINYLDLCDTPQKTEDYLSRLMVQVEELEGKFAEFEEFLRLLSDRREDLYAAFETRRLQLVEQRNKRSSALLATGTRILKGIQHRAAQMEELQEIHAYFAADLLVEKVRGIIAELTQMEDSGKAGDLQAQLKSAREEAIRQSKDRRDLYVDGDHTIRMGRHSFAVNRQALDLTVVPREGSMYLHITGTHFYEKITDEVFLRTQAVWGMSLPSESADVYRAEFLAWQMMQDLSLSAAIRPLLPEVQSFMATRYEEGYLKGIHDHDASVLLGHLLELREGLGFLQYSPEARACAIVAWWSGWEEEAKNALSLRIQSAKLVLRAFPGTSRFEALTQSLHSHLAQFCQASGAFDQGVAAEAAAFLFATLQDEGSLTVSGEAVDLQEAFGQYLRQNELSEDYEKSLAEWQSLPLARFDLIRTWLAAFVEAAEKDTPASLVLEAAALMLLGTHVPTQRLDLSARRTVTDLRGEHGVIEEGGRYELSYHRFQAKLGQFVQDIRPQYFQMAQLKHDLIARERESIRLESFQPKIMSSFVRNKLIDQYYLPLVGDNLAKQIGTVGENMRTDRQGLLLLISPPGYGKTTLMEYVANRMGLIFMKINGPAIGHEVTSLDPASAPHASAREELHKLALSLEMGDNVMLYLDDIQHLHPEFLQKFISLTDAQRKIEGVYKGRSRTYDLRGRRVAVVMAGNPYTESGDKFRIPDMLANRADIYNLGDIIGAQEGLFRLSYLENALTSHPLLTRLVTASSSDQHIIFRAAEKGEEQGLALEGNLSPEEVQDMLAVLRKMIAVREVVLKVNHAYIASAGQQEAYRVEPPFLLQGSYRNMARLTEKLSPLMNDQELQALLLAHYTSEAQTLSAGTEANLLRFRRMIGVATPEENQRWEDILRMFGEQKQLSMDRLGQLVQEMKSFTQGLAAISDALKK